MAKNIYQLVLDSTAGAPLLFVVISLVGIKILITVFNVLYTPFTSCFMRPSS